MIQLLQDKKAANESSGLPPGVKPSPIEEQYILAEYPVLTGTLTVRPLYLTLP